MFEASYKMRPVVVMNLLPAAEWAGKEIDLLFVTMICSSLQQYVSDVQPDIRYDPDQQLLTFIARNEDDAQYVTSSWRTVLELLRSRR